MNRARKIIFWTVGVVVTAFVILVIARIPNAIDKRRTDGAVAKIRATKLTLDDVMGKSLPLAPSDPDSSVQGLDSNHNGIRDDVELAIFAAYPNSARTRAVLLQYALALQLEMTQPVVNMETVTAVAGMGDRALNCMRNNTSRDGVSLNEYMELLHDKQNFVKSRQTNTDERDKYQRDFYEKLGSYSSPQDGCDLDISKL